jgi:hypothetical protein
MGQKDKRQSTVQTGSKQMGWNNGASSNQLYRPEASRLLTGAPADKLYNVYYVLYKIIRVQYILQ